MLGPGFIGDGVSHAPHQRRVPGRGQPNGLREDGGYAGPAQSVQRLIPPVVCRDAKAFNRRRGKEHLGHFFLQRHLSDELVDALGECGQLCRGVCIALHDDATNSMDVDEQIWG